ncbi:MAG: hypothetical protein JWP76_1417 [Dactylosporangium sp.]|nr:hypothetical protein [Dactylosporangium sp.]
MTLGASGFHKLVLLVWTIGASADAGSFTNNA